MQVKVKLFATLRNGRFDISDMDIEKGNTISMLLKILNIGEKDAAIIFINGIHGSIDSVLKPGDEVGIFPPVGGG